MIEPASPEDAAPCAAILHEWISENPWFPNRAPKSASEQAMRVRIETGMVLVARTNGETVGFIAFEKGYLDCLYLAPAARNNGLGKRLLAKAKSTSPAGIGLWVLEKNEAARRFYRREGFLESARSDGADNEEGLPDIRMEWSQKEALNA